jgi:hypothetical protein
MNELIIGSANGALPFIRASQRLLRMSKGLSGLQTALGQNGGHETLWVKRYVKEGSGKGHLSPQGVRRGTWRDALLSGT